jgi:hypothetical protein
MRTREHGRTSPIRRFACASAMALCFLRLGVATGDFTDSWNEKDAGGGGGGGSPTPALPGGVASPTSESPTPKPLPTPPPPTPAPTPDPKDKAKFPTADKYACAAMEALAKDIADKIEAKPANGDKTVYPGEDIYNQALKDAKAAGKNDTEAKEAARKALKDALTDGNVVDKGTGETLADKARREWEGAQRGNPVPAPAPVKVPLAVPPATDYMNKCATAGVPLPPKWGDPAWVKKGNLSQVFASKLPTTEVWVAQSPNGVCYALPRIDSGGTIQLLGQICQNPKTGRTCFWDNKDPSDGKTGLAVTPGLGPEKMAGGDKLEENCTECHRGDNAFIVHPGTALEFSGQNPCSGGGSKPTDVATGAKYTPMGAPKFQNPPDDALDKKLKACNQCHSIPKLSKSYCGTVLEGMIRSKEMPPGGDQSDPDTADDIKTLRAECAKL